MTERRAESLFVDAEQLGEVLRPWAMMHDADHRYDFYANRTTLNETSIQMPAVEYLAHWAGTSAEGTRKILKGRIKDRVMTKLDLADKLLLAAGEQSALADGRLALYRQRSERRGRSRVYFYEKVEEGV